MNENVKQQLTLLATSHEPVFMTGQEGQELVNLGYASPDPQQPGRVPGSCLVSLTPAGWQAYQSLATQPMNSDPATPTSIEKPKIDVGIPMPAPRKRGGANNLVPRESIYSFDDLLEPSAGPNGEIVYSSFHVPCTPEKPEPWKSMASNVSAANKRSEVEVKDEAGNVVMETVTKKKAIKDESGNIVKDEDGKRQYTEEQVRQPKTEATKKFVARRVGKEDPAGEGVRVYRVQLDF
jgi:hypothetical protein